MTDHFGDDPFPEVDCTATNNKTTNSLLKQMVNYLITSTNSTEMSKRIKD